ncbi:MAG: DNA polymerase, partial [Myxococcota bacterium]|nr:DNA polymerase [Myxococcota bacterium]
PVNAVFGFTNMVLKLLKKEKPDYLAIVFDTAAPTFRREIYEAYKANRPPPPEDLVPQFPLVREVTRALGIPALEMDGWEADDIIGTLACRFGDQDIETVVVSSDKDLMQLVGGNCSMLDTMKDVHYGPDEVMEKMGVRPDQIIDFLALMGDASDNIPGVPGIGKKTAATLLDQYNDLEGIYEHIEEIKGKRRENLETSRDVAQLSRTLATIATDVPLPMDLNSLRRQEPDRAVCTELFGRLGFKTWHREFHEASEPADSPTGEPLDRDAFRLVTTERELHQLVAVLKAAPLIAFDTETTSLDAYRASLVGISLATDLQHAWYVPVGHTALDGAPQVPLDVVRGLLGPVFADPARPMAAHNAKYDLQILERHGMPVDGLVFDSMLASYLADPGRYRHSLDNVSLDRLNHKTIKFEDVAGSGKNQVTFDRVPLSTARDYACEDAQLVMALHKALAPEVSELGLDELLQDLELPLARVLAEMETTGICIDAEVLEALSDELGARADSLLQRCHELAGEPFNVGSPKQLSRVLFEIIGLKPIKKTKTGFS